MTDVWVTKYALSDGIKKCALSERKDDSGYAWVEWPGGFTGTMMFTKTEWFETEAAAMENAEQRRIAKIASLRKQISKLEKLSFKSAGTT